MNEKDVDRQVETREPIDISRLCDEASTEVLAMAVHQQPNQAQQSAIDGVVFCGAAFARSIVRALPEGNERIIALNNIKSTIMWAKHGVMLRSIEIASS